jgi:6-phosphogluconate dehydrogenase (decarboxylating)
MTRTGNTVAVIGLGVMGAPMAVNLIDAGYDAVGFNRAGGRSSRMRNPAHCGSTRAPSALTRRSVSRPSAATTASVPWTLLCPAALRHDAYLPEQLPLSA